MAKRVETTEAGEGSNAMARSVTSFSAVVMALASSIVASAQSSKPSGDAMEAAKTYDRAILNQDAAAFEKVLSDDFTLIDWHGEKHDKAWMVAEAKKGTIKLEIAKSENNVYRSYGDTVVWTGDWTEKGTDGGEPFENARRQNLWVSLRLNHRFAGFSQCFRGLSSWDVSGFRYSWASSHQENFIKRCR